VPADPTTEQGRAVAADGGYGSRSQFETEVRVRFPTANEYTSWSFTPLDKMLGNLTASGLHFERHHGGIRRSILPSTSS
jgi:sulfane dehydrogenase subunit SoxC